MRAEEGKGEGSAGLILVMGMKGGGGEGGGCGGGTGETGGEMNVCGGDVSLSLCVVLVVVLKSRRERGGGRERVKGEEGREVVLTATTLYRGCGVYKVVVLVGVAVSGRG